MPTKNTDLFGYLEDNSRITNLRNSVEPILANALLPHFTDHTVDNSDRVVTIVNDLIRPV